MYSYSLYRFHLLLSLLLWFHWSFAKDIEKVESDLGVIRVQVPGFDPDGRLSWELKAATVRPLGNELYEAVNPLLKTYGKQGVRTEAKSSAGTFHLKHGHAFGGKELFVNGQSFSVRGKKWKWWQKSNTVNHRMVFEEGGELSFDMYLAEFLLSSDFPEPEGCPKETVKNDKLMTTVARADYIELMAVNERSHRFLLEGNVSVVGNELSLSCEKMEVKFLNDTNSSSGDLGEISFITALGKVELAQKGRVSYSDHLKMDISKGEVLLEGSEGKPARVVDNEWGEVSGPTIVLEKGNRRARVLGGKGRDKPRLELPALPNLGIERKGKAP